VAVEEHPLSARVCGGTCQTLTPPRHPPYEPASVGDLPPGVNGCIRFRISHLPPAVKAIAKGQTEDEIENGVHLVA
jgi:hypothetical protein